MITYKDFCRYMAIKDDKASAITIVKIDADELGRIDLHPVYGDFFSFFIVTRGDASYNINSHMVHATADDVLAFSPRHLVGVESYSQDFEAILCMARVPLVEDILTHVANCKILGDFFITNDIPYLPASFQQNGKAIKETFHLMFTIAETYPDEEGTADMKVNLLKVLMALIASKLSVPSQPTATEHKEIIYRNFIALVSKHYHQQHSTSFYANELHVTPVYLARIVRQYSLISAKEFILNLLNRDAMQMLLYSDLQISQIANELGFADIETFSKFFKSRNGASPTLYRSRKE